MYLKILFALKHSKSKQYSEFHAKSFSCGAGGTDDSIDIVKGTDNECREDVLRTWK